MKKLIAHRVTLASHPLLIEIVRAIFNANIADLATKPLHVLEQDEQQEWWKNLDHQNVQLHVYSPVEQPWQIVAFSLVRNHGHFSTPQFAIAGGYSGRGYGTEIIQHYIEVAGQPLYGQQLVANEAIRHMNQKAGWKVLYEREGVEYLFHPGRAPFLPCPCIACTSADDARQREIYDEIVRYSQEGA